MATGRLSNDVAWTNLLQEVLKLVAANENKRRRCLMVLVLLESAGDAETVRFARPFLPSRTDDYMAMFSNSNPAAGLRTWGGDGISRRYDFAEGDIMEAARPCSTIINHRMSGNLDVLLTLCKPFFDKTRRDENNVSLYFKNGVTYLV